MFNSALVSPFIVRIQQWITYWPANGGRAQAPESSAKLLGERHILYRSPAIKGHPKCLRLVSVLLLRAFVSHCAAAEQWTRADDMVQDRTIRCVVFAVTRWTDIAKHCYRRSQTIEEPHWWPKEHSYRTPTCTPRPKWTKREKKFAFKSPTTRQVAPPGKWTKLTYFNNG